MNKALFRRISLPQKLCLHFFNVDLQFLKDLSSKNNSWHRAKCTAKLLFYYEFLTPKSLIVC